MAITNIQKLLDRSGMIAKRVAKKQLSKSRGGMLPMNTWGTLGESLEFKIKVEGMIALLTLEGADYGSILDKGIDKKGKIPYTRGSGSKKPSAYIHGLALWATKKFYSGDYKAGLKAAFAIANKQKKDATAPANKGWIEEVKDELDNKINMALATDTITAINMDVMSILNIKIP